MTQQDKDLLLRDLSARLPYELKANVTLFNKNRLCVITGVSLNRSTGLYSIEIRKPNRELQHIQWPTNIIKPYLRPLSSLTQEERNKFCDIGGVISYRPSDGKQYIVAYIPEALDYLNSIHADYHGLIEKGLAIEVTDENNPYK